MHALSWCCGSPRQRVPPRTLRFPACARRPAARLPLAPRLAQRQRANTHISRYAAGARRPAERLPLAALSPAPARYCPHFALRGLRASPRRTRRANPALRGVRAARARVAHKPSPRPARNAISRSRPPSAQSSSLCGRSRVSYSLAHGVPSPASAYTSQPSRTNGNLPAYTQDRIPRGTSRSLRYPETAYLHLHLPAGLFPAGSGTPPENLR